MIRSVADLLSPHDPALVARALTERTRLHLKGDRAAEFARLLPWETFNTLPTAERMLTSQLRIARRGQDAFFDMAAARTDYHSDRPLRAEAVHGLAEQGMSLVLNEVERLVPRVAALNATVERHFMAETAANCYVSFQQESAFPPHFDDHDVLVLQLHGRKVWRCHGQPYRFPFANAHFPAPKDPGPVELEAMLEPGDILFLPRGEVHWAEVAGPSSMHLTIALRAARSGLLLRWLRERLEREEIGREDIGRLDDAVHQAVRGERLRGALHALADSVDLADFHAFEDSLREPFRPFNLGLAHPIAAATVVLPSLRRRVSLPDDGKLAYAGRTTTITPDERAALALLLERDGMTVDEIRAALPDRDARAAVAGLARKALVFLLAD